MKKVGIIFVLILMISAFSLAQEEIQEVRSNPIVGTTEQTICCEEVNADTYCQDIKVEDCPTDSRQPPTACESTSFCRGGFCYDSEDGTCLDNVPQIVCNDNGGTWSEEKPASCNLGCCVLGDQASFVTLVMCKRLSGFYGLETEWDSGITNEPLCILTAGSHVKGACVYEEDFEKTCKFVSRGDCTADKVLGGGIIDEGTSAGTGVSGSDVTSGGDTSASTSGEDASASGENTNLFGGVFGDETVQESPGGVEFFEGKLCSAEELNTNCGPSKETTCLDGKEEVYFVDTCGNPANIYDAGKVNDDDYWSNVKKKEEVCGFGDGNGNSQTCGNCDYSQGSFCREKNSESASPTYGEFICADLNCDVDGQEKLHGESWCVFDSPGAQGSGKNPVGSKFFRNLCNNGEVMIEPCAEYRQEECIENNVAGFTEAACRVNRWQDCTAQTNTEDCSNGDRRDCKWMEGIEYILMGRALMAGAGGDEGQGPIEGNSLAGIGDRMKQMKENGEEVPLGACVPKNPPGLNFWGTEGGQPGAGQGAGVGAGAGGPNAGQAIAQGGGMTEAETVCTQANAMCPVTYTKGLFGDWECSEHCECLPGGPLEKKRADLCMSMGDCGPNVNIIGTPGSGKGYKIFEKEQKDEGK